MRIGQCAFVLVCSSLWVGMVQGISWLSGIQNGNTLFTIGMVITVIGFLAWRMSPERIQRRVAVWIENLEARPIPKLTPIRVMMVLSVVVSWGFSFVWLAEDEKRQNFPFLLLIGGLIASLNFLENHWVANDQRRGGAVDNRWEGLS